MIAQVTTGFTGAGALVLVSPSCKFLSIFNEGTTNWRLSVDGGGASTGNNGTDPTTTAGLLIGAGQERVFNFAQYPSLGPRTIAAIQDASGTVKLTIVSDDKDSQVLSHA